MHPSSRPHPRLLAALCTALLGACQAVSALPPAAPALPQPVASASDPGAPSGQAVPAQRLQQLPSMESLFEKIDAAYARPASRIALTLNPQWGYPEKVFIDYSQRIADEELIYEISDFAE